MKIRLPALAIVAILLAGCAAGAAQPSEQAEPGFAREASPETLRIGLVDAVVLDPSAINPASPSQVLVADLLFDRLTAADPQSGAAVPAVAESWTVSPDGLAWSFVIDPEARFSDGRPITASAAKAAIDRVVALGVRSLSGSSLAVVEAVEAPDPSTLVVRLGSPFSALAELLADPAFGIVADETTGGEGTGGTFPVGSGSYAVEGRTDSAMTVRRVAGSTASIEKLHLRWYPDASAAYGAFLADEVDLAVVPPERIAAATDAGVQVLGHAAGQPLLRDEPRRPGVAIAGDAPRHRQSGRPGRHREPAVRGSGGGDDGGRRPRRRRAP